MQVPKGYWDYTSNLRKYLDHRLSVLGHEAEFWKTAPRYRLNENKGSTWLRKYNTMEQVLIRAYPEQCWDFVRKTSKGQIYLQKLVRELFENNTEILSSYRHPSVK